LYISILLIRTLTFENSCQDDEKAAYVSSKLYLQKKKREDAKSRRISAVKKKLSEMKSTKNNRRKKQMSKLGLDKSIVDPKKVGVRGFGDMDAALPAKGKRGAKSSKMSQKRGGRSRSK